ncbi:MAG: protein phosphatase 2C domain-containing protein [Thermodesulfobacteriota bacterium]
MFGFLKRLFAGADRPLSFHGRTDTGRVRSHNEDSFCSLANRRLFVVADGMGGHRAGEVASQLAIESLVDFISDSRLREAHGDGEKIRQLLLAGFHHANQAVMQEAAANPERRGMGCTMVACHLDGATLHTCHVGDARCYLAHQGILAQLTQDHTGLSAIPGTNNANTDTAQLRRVITRAIGFPFPEEPEYHCTPLHPADRILLCSDGLWNMLDQLRLEQILLNAASPEEASSQLVEEANAEGGRDNITALTIFY